MTGKYATTGEDHKSRMKARQAKIEKELEDAKANIPEEAKEEVTQRQLESDLA